MATDALRALGYDAVAWLREKKRAAAPRSRALRRLRRRARLKRRFSPGTIEVDGFRVRYVDLLSVYMEYKDIFGERIYHFRAPRPAPRIVDGGGYIGMSVLYFKSVYPDAEITCFEPDPEIFAVLEENVRANSLAGVELVCAGLAADEGETAIRPDGADGGRLTEAGTRSVRTVPLSRWLTDEVDFLKLNIEGFELEVLEEAEERLGNVRELVIEYHGWPDAPQRLGALLELLDRAGFRYLLNHFDYQTNGAVRPPFSLRRDTSWFLLVYARRNDLL